MLFIPLRPALAACLATLTVVAATACDTKLGKPASAPVPSAAPGTTALRGICVDPSGSSPGEFSQGIMARLADRVETWVPTDTAQSFVEAPPFPGLSLVVRIVATASPTTNDGYSVLVDIPAIPALPGPPDSQAGNFVELRSAYIKQRELVRTQRATAHSAATDGAKRLREFPLREEESGVTACASVLALMVTDVAMTIRPKATDVKFLVASDLEDNKELQTHGSFGGAPLTILQTCPRGNLDRCQEWTDTFSASMKKLEVGPIAVYRSELATRTIDLWLEPAS